MAKIQGPKEGKTNSNIYKEEWVQPWPMGSKIYPKVHENPRAFFSSSSPSLLESSIQYLWGVGLHQYDSWEIQWKFSSTTFLEKQYDMMRETYKTSMPFLHYRNMVVLVPHRRRPNIYCHNLPFGGKARRNKMAHLLMKKMRGVATNVYLTENVRKTKKDEGLRILKIRVQELFMKFWYQGTDVVPDVTTSRFRTCRVSVSVWTD